MQQAQALRHRDDIRIVTDVAGGRAQVNDRLCLGALHAVGVNVRHHVVPHLLFALLSDLVVDIVPVRLQLGDLLVCNL